MDLFGGKEEAMDNPDSQRDAADDAREPGKPGDAAAEAPRHNPAAKSVQRAASAPPAAAAPSPKAPAAPQPERAAVRFEDAFARLEALVGEMERGELALEDMLTRFEEGVALVRHCNSYLKQAQTRVEQYVEQKDGHWVLKDLE